MLISAIQTRPKSEHLYLYNARPDEEPSKLKSYNWTFASRRAGLETVDGEIYNSKFKRLANSAGLTDETTRCDVKICSLPEEGFNAKKLEQIKEETIMMAVSVPLKDAMTFLHEQTEKDINVGLNTIAATANAQRVLSIDSDHDNKNIEPNLLWDLKKSKKIKTQIQKEGFDNPKYKEHYALAA